MTRNKCPYCQELEGKLVDRLNENVDLVFSLREAEEKARRLEELLFLSEEGEKQAIASAMRDPLTGLLNRAAFRESAGHLFALAKRDSRPITVMYIDLNDFKKVNDVHGHAVGDEVLVRFAEVFKICFRASDIVAREGGDEFVAIMPDTSLGQAGHIRKKLWQYTTSVVFGNKELDKGSRLKVSVAVGIVEATSEMVRLEDLLAAADAKMYRAKAKMKKVHRNVS